jgi:hypothetical protein
MEDVSPLEKANPNKGEWTSGRTVERHHVTVFLHKIYVCIEQRHLDTRASGKWEVLNIFTAVSPQGIGLTQKQFQSLISVESFFPIWNALRFHQVESIEDITSCNDIWFIHSHLWAI